MTPIAVAAAPMRQDAITRAEQFARERINELTTILEAAGYDIQVAAPWPHSSDHRYFVMKGLREEIGRIVHHTKASRSMRDPDPVVIDHGKVDQFVQMSKEDAAAQYDAFVVKLENKIGEHTAATLTGNHVWGYSILTVTAPDGSTQRWQTQQIINFSKNGLVFNQWPSRRVK